MAPTAVAAPTRDLYMVKDLQSVDGLYYGDFAALRKKGRKVVGAIGAFYSEYFCIRGRSRRANCAPLSTTSSTSQRASTRSGGRARVPSSGSRARRR